MIFELKLLVQDSDRVACFSQAPFTIVDYELFGHLKVQMLGRLPDGPARKNFENQVSQSCTSCCQDYVKRFNHVTTMVFKDLYL